MEDDVQTFRVCQNQLELESLTTALEEAGIPFVTASSASSFDLSTLGSDRTGQMAVRLRSRDFDRANQVLLDRTESDLTEVPADHYLNEYADHELLEILAAAHEWNEFDVACAKLLLTQRGFDLSGGLIEEMQAKRLAVEREGKQGSRVLLIFAFMSAIFGVFFALGGIIALLIAWSFRSMKSTDPSGHRFYTYNQGTRKEGQVLKWFALLCLAIWLISKFVFLPDLLRP